MNEPEEVNTDTPAKHTLDLDNLQIVKDAQKNAAASIAQALSGSQKWLLDDMSRSLGVIANSIQFPKQELFTVDGTPLNLPQNPQYETNRLLREVSSKLDNLSEQNAKLVAPHFYPDNSEIIFANKRISIPKNTNQAQLCNALFSEPEKEWDWSEMLEAWGYDETAYKKDDWRKVYNTAREVNTKVAIETGVKDLLAVTQKTVQINPNYLAQIS